METTNESVPVQVQLGNPAVWAVAGPLLKWVGKSLASGIVGAVGGKIFAEVMSAIGMGGPDLVGKLDQISNQLGEVQRSLDRLTAMTEEILAQLTELKEFMAKSMKQQELSAAMRRIETVYGAPAQTALLGDNGAVSMHMLMVTLPKTAGVTPAQLKEAASDFAAYATEVPYAINTIHDVLTDRAFGTDSLLTYWAQELIREIRKGRMQQEQACQILEGYFLQAVSTQLKGVSTHCVALGVRGVAGEALINQYLTETFSPKMRNQTRAFVNAVEVILFSTIAPTMAVGNRQGMGELREFPRKIDEILLRADLLAAALNLAGAKLPSDSTPVSLNAAIQGIYGRGLYRPGDLNSSGQPPRLSVKGYPEQAGDRVYQTPLRCISLVQPNTAEVSILQDATLSFATMAHYHWAFGSPAPGAGAPIDPGQRDGVVPVLYPVFGPDSPSVLAASFLDVTRLYRTVPPQVAQLDTFRPFRFSNPYITITHQEMNRHRNPLTDHGNPVFDCAYQVAHIFKAQGYYGSDISYKLFRYQGAKTKVRLTANIQHTLSRGPRLDCGAGTAFAQEWDLIESIDLRRVGGSSQRLFDSRSAYPPDSPMRINTIVSDFRYPFPREKSGQFSCTFDLEPGEYELIYEQIAYFPEYRRRYEGWHGSGITFKLHTVSLELVP